MPHKLKEDKNRWQRELMAKRRAKYMSDKVCAECGSRDRLEIDHVFDDRPKDWNKLWSWGAERRERELAKTQVLCKPCHHKKTCLDKGWKQHGTVSMYMAHKCRCERCKQAKAEYARNWRKKRGL